MKKCLAIMCFISSLSVFAFETLTQAEMDNAIIKANFATDLWFCDSQALLSGQNLNACENTLIEAKLTLNSFEITEIIEEHNLKLNRIELFVNEVKAGKDYIELLPNVKALKSAGISLNMLKRKAEFIDEELLMVELAFERAKTEIERILESI